MSSTLINKITKGLSVVLFFITTTANAGLIFDDQSAFNSQLNSYITDDYSDPGYVFIQNNLAMSTVFGETDYMSTGFSNHNIVNFGYYCAGCNGSFQLGFTTTSLGTSDGVFGVGMQIGFNSIALPYDAFVTFGDNSTLSVDLGTGARFFGITSSSLIKSIHFGIGDGSDITQSGSFRINDLTIGSARDVPEPGSLALILIGAIGLIHSRKRRSL